MYEWKYKRGLGGIDDMIEAWAERMNEVNAERRKWGNISEWTEV